MVEKIVDRVYITGGLLILIVVIMAASSCGTSQKCNNEMVNEYRNW
jgi:hypothetical protein